MEGACIQFHKYKCHSLIRDASWEGLLSFPTHMNSPTYTPRWIFHNKEVDFHDKTDFDLTGNIQS